MKLEYINVVRIVRNSKCSNQLMNETMNFVLECNVRMDIKTHYKRMPRVKVGVGHAKEPSLLNGHNSRA